ncbi:hypothetical protein K438DRAFT_1782686 [Mycena galopus ATCC 62051]|nr:hypothetical protein K438DRAFT_1782686 [Mycena galopus ATCC 62051]
MNYIWWGTRNSKCCRLSQPSGTNLRVKPLEVQKEVAEVYLRGTGDSGPSHDVATNFERDHGKGDSPVPQPKKALKTRSDGAGNGDVDAPNRPRKKRSDAGRLRARRAKCLPLTSYVPLSIQGSIPQFPRDFTAIFEAELRVGGVKPRKEMFALPFWDGIFEEREFKSFDDEGVSTCSTAWYSIESGSAGFLIRKANVSSVVKPHKEMFALPFLDSNFERVSLMTRVSAQLLLPTVQPDSVHRQLGSSAHLSVLKSALLEMGSSRATSPVSCIPRTRVPAPKYTSLATHPYGPPLRSGIAGDERDVLCNKEYYWHEINPGITQTKVGLENFV